MSKFSYKPDIPESLLPEIQRLFGPFEWLIPAWCERVSIHWDSSGDGDYAAKTTTHFAYRWANIDLFPMFWDQDGQKKQQSVMHELLHIPTAPVADYARATFATLLEDENPKFYQHAKEQLRVRYEGMVQDLTRIIMSIREKSK